MDFEEIYRTYFNDVFVYIRKLSGDENIAEEITSQTFFKALSSINKFKGECDVRVWLCQIAKNCYFTYLKKNSKTENIDNLEVLNIQDFTCDINEIISNQEQSKLIQNALHTIPEPYKEVFMWRVFAELNFKEIGQIFDKSDNWACVTYHRARNMIKEKLEETNL
ncbi:MAG: sigma-70 family RNA polymerase sigma factor [Clostridia bacterium]|nr:sigma-70 family RNA polymerase sigma factor [Clostridia bacterium]